MFQLISYFNRVLKFTVVFAVVMSVAFVFSACDAARHDAAVAEFEAAAVQADMHNEELRSAIDSAQAVLDLEKDAYGDDAKNNLQAAIAQAQAALITIPDMPSSTEEIRAVAESMKSVDFSHHVSTLEVKRLSFENAIKQLEQITAPAEDFIIERLKLVSTIIDTAAATADADPDGMLGQDGGYRSAVFFSDSRVDQEALSRQGRYTNEILDKGTDAGGTVEVFDSVEAATERSRQLDEIALGQTAQAGTGKHHVLQTIVIRTSALLTEAQHNDLVDSIKTAFLEIR